MSEEREESKQRELSFLLKLFASGLYSGYSPIASGTVGAAVGLAVYLIPGFEQPLAILPIAVITFLLGIKYSGRMEEVYGEDPAQVTIDEVVGMWISLILLPKSLPIIVLAFFLFRILDILKPSPARYFDRRKGGFGIMMDDVISGIYTNVVLQVLVALNILS
ncbi:MAG: phosphatidylglycerophosphatase A [bacterium]